MPSHLALDENSYSNRGHHVSTTNVMNEIMHPFCDVRDENLYA